MSNTAWFIRNEIFKVAKKYKKPLPLFYKIWFGLYGVLSFVYVLLFTPLINAPLKETIQRSVGVSIIIIFVILIVKARGELKAGPNIKKQKKYLCEIKRVLEINGIDSEKKFNQFYQEIKNDMTKVENNCKQVVSFSGKLFLNLFWIPAGFFLGLYFNKYFENYLLQEKTMEVWDGLLPVLKLLKVLLLVSVLGIVLLNLLRKSGIEMLEIFASKNKKIVLWLEEMQYYNYTFQSK